MRIISMVLIGMFAAVTQAHAMITKTDIRYSNTTEEVRFYSTAPLRIQKSFALESPPRIVIDLAKIANSQGVGLSPQYQGRLIRDIRFGQFSPSQSRIVLDTSAETLSYKTSVQDNVLIVTLKHSGQAIKQPPPSILTNLPKPEPKPLHVAKIAKKPIVVIDAGHGGKDSGAIGKQGTKEKHVTLDYAKALRHALLKTGKFRVALTRDSDEYLFLKQRVAIARELGADAFISIHADSNPRSDAQGLSVYTLSEKASDAEAAALAAQENKADVIGGMDLSTKDETVAGILIDLAQRETTNKSSQFAEELLASMDPKIPLLTNSHRYAGFRVLKAPDVPSVLVEVGFLSNHSDEKRVLSREYRDRVTASAVLALEKFLLDE